MHYDKFGQGYTTTDELCDLLYKDPNLDVSKFKVEDWDEYNFSVSTMYAPFKKVQEYHPLPLNYDIVSYDKMQQENWYMPDEYKNFDIAGYVLGLCKTEQELQRVGQELLLFYDRGLENLLRYMKYLVDTMRKNNVVMGVGRGSSTASYVLYLLGVHKINSIYYDLPIEEFLK
jgi:Bacterial DNA polymerase III alpha NTPase domain